MLLALALTPVPELLLLDEPLAGMDRAGTARFYEIVSGLRRVLDLSVLLVSHDLPAAAAIADRMVFLHQRTILCEGAPADVLRQPDGAGNLRARSVHSRRRRRAPGDRSTLPPPPRPEKS